jgi:hypothetical protein
VQQVLYGQIKDHGFSGWRQVAPSLRDQRHLSAALDATGRVHVAWREGSIRDGAADGPVTICYSMRAANGSWLHPVQVSGADESASSPSIATTTTSVCVAWVAWAPATLNSESQSDNGFPADNSTVEGQLNMASKLFDAETFDAPTVLDDGSASYPSWAVQSIVGDNPPPLIWTTPGEAGTAGGQARLWLGWYTSTPH